MLGPTAKAQLEPEQANIHTVKMNTLELIFSLLSDRAEKLWRERRKYATLSRKTQIPIKGPENTRSEHRCPLTGRTKKTYTISNMTFQGKSGIMVLQRIILPYKLRKVLLELGHNVIKINYLLQNCQLLMAKTPYFYSSHSACLSHCLASSS